MYEDLVRALRAADARPCPDMGCPGSGECPTAGCLFREAADAIEALQRACANYAEMATEQEWIPVKERLPENGAVVVTISKRCEDWFYRIEEYLDDGGFNYSKTFDRTVVWWIPFPEPPKEEER